MYLASVIDWHSRYVIAWRLSNTLDGSFCLDLLDEALAQGRPEVFNTDQGVQFTAAAFTARLQAAGVQVSMNGKGRCLDNVFVERLWRTVKYEDIYLRNYESVPELTLGLGALLPPSTTNSDRTRRRGLPNTWGDLSWQRGVSVPRAVKPQEQLGCVFGGITPASDGAAEVPRAVRPGERVIGAPSAGLSLEELLASRAPRRFVRRGRCIAGKAETQEQAGREENGASLTVGKTWRSVAKDHSIFVQTMGSTSSFHPNRVRRIFLVES